MIKDDLQGKHVYLDAGMFIYLLEGFESSEPLTDLKDMISKNEIEISICNLVYTEIIPYCVRDGKNIPLHFDEISNFLDRFVPKNTPEDIGFDAKTFGGGKEINPLASIHLMTAIKNKCQVFLTNDRNIKTVPDGLKLIHFSDYDLNLKKESTI